MNLQWLYPLQKNFKNQFNTTYLHQCLTQDIAEGAVIETYFTTKQEFLVVRFSKYNNSYTVVKSIPETFKLK